MVCTLRWDRVWSHGATRCARCASTARSNSPSKCRRKRRSCAVRARSAFRLRRAPGIPAHWVLPPPSQGPTCCALIRSSCATNTTITWQARTTDLRAYAAETITLHLWVSAVEGGVFVDYVGFVSSPTRVVDYSSARQRRSADRTCPVGQMRIREYSLENSYIPTFLASHARLGNSAAIFTRKRCSPVGHRRRNDFFCWCG